MSASVVNFDKWVTLAQAATIIEAVGKDVTIMLEGEPGIGKSSILKHLMKGADEYIKAYVDVTNLDLGDIAMPWIDKEAGCTHYVPNVRFGMHTGAPVICMLDELTKGSQPVQNMLLPLMLERRTPARPLHPDSIIFCTGNLSGDGVGDNLKAHAANRLSRLRVRKPNAQEWVEWGIANGIVPEVLAAVRQFPQCLASYTEGDSQKDNMYIFNPKRAATAFVTPRSLEKVSHIVRQRKLIGDYAMEAAITGTVGAKFAQDLLTFLHVADQLPNRTDYLNHPDTCPVPSDPMASAMLVFGAVTWVERDTLTPWMTYLKRMSKEHQALFCTSLWSSPKQKLAATSKAFVDWARDNSYIL